MIITIIKKYSYGIWIVFEQNWEYQPTGRNLLTGEFLQAGKFLQLWLLAVSNFLCLLTALIVMIVAVIWL